ncbi:putative xlf family protein [Golovinomyces cichoracearum]|uniref:Non-homologous end-joining factor 1 n=1 Tax=Golovinomyces cichoracearum TaxID=62708 RepID=A0A420I8F1_9PEZI|nr:putative xlf family protein [Golovinomyces cichoracearum]
MNHHNDLNITKRICLYILTTHPILTKLKGSTEQIPLPNRRAIELGEYKMAWKPLKLSTSAAISFPTLLYTAKISSSSYTIHLTDLTTIWSESLSPQEIRKRSHEERTSIDPCSDDQLAILLEKIASALTGAQGTSLHLNLDDVTCGQAQLITLSIHVILPEGIRALDWPVRLSTKHPILLTDQLTIPLLRAHHKLAKNVELLSQELKQKDFVIGKMIDKFQEHGIDFGQVFPQALGKQRSRLKKEFGANKVTGLTKFDFESWKTSQDLGENEPDIAFLIEELFAGPCIEPIRFEIKDSLDLKKHWWEEIIKTSIRIETGCLTTAISLAEPKLKRIISTKRDEQAFPQTLANFKSSNENKYRVDTISTRAIDVCFQNTSPVETSTSSAIIRNSEHLFFKKTVSKPKIKLEEKDDDESSEDDAFSPLIGDRRELEMLGGEKNVLKREPHTSAQKVYSPNLSPRKKIGSLMVIKGKKRRSGPSAGSTTEKLIESENQGNISLVVAKTTSKILEHGTTQDIKKNFTTNKIASDPTQNKIDCLAADLRDANTIEDISYLRKPDEKPLYEESSLIKANKKRDELKKEIDLRMSYKSPVKKKRRF